MTFFLLKWVFNAIKLTSEKDDKHFKGQPFVTKTELVKQLEKNEELCAALGLERSSKKLERAVKKAPCVKEACLLWSEFMDFFFCKEDPQFRIHTSPPWWLQIDMDGHRIRPEESTPVKGLKLDSDEELTSSQKK